MRRSNSQWRLNDDAIIEANETFTLALSGLVTTQAPTASIDITDDATGTIQDNDAAAVTIEDETVNETAGTVTFTATLDRAVQGGFTVDVVYADVTATGGNTDYDSVLDTLTFAGNAGETQQFTVAITDDNLVELTETFGLSMNNLTPATAPASSIDVTDTATGTITDNDSATFTIDDVTVNEADMTMTFTVSLDTAIDTNVVVDVSYADVTATGGGADYDSAADQVTFLAGTTTAQTVTVAITEDNVVELTETFTASLSSATALGTRNVTVSDTATGTITNDDAAKVSIADATVTEGGSLSFDVTLDNPVDVDTIVTYSTSDGTATTADSDYTAEISQTITIMAGMTSGTIVIATTADSQIELDEDITVTLNGVAATGRDVTLDGMASSATGTIENDDTAEVTIVANDPNAAEPSDNGQFTVSLSDISDQDTVISYTVSGDATAGSDYTALGGTVTILAGNLTAVIDVSVIDENLLEDNENVTVTLDAIIAGRTDSISVGTANSDTVTIADNDTAEVTITANDNTAAEPSGNNGQFTVTISNPSDTDTVVAYTVSGDATAGSDYTTLGGTVTILANQTTATIDVAVLDDVLLEDNETVTVTLDSITSGDADITVGTANSDTVTISDNDTAEVTIAANDNSAAEPSGNNGQFTVSISNPSDTDTVVAYTVSGDATAGSDYTTLSGTVTILANQTTATIDVAVLDDVLLEDNETVTVTLDSITSGDVDITVGAANSDTVTISDNDTAEVTILANDNTAAEPSGNNGQFTVSISNPSDTDTVVAYTVSGDATAGSDYTTLSGTVTILANQTTATIDVAVLDDLLLEDNETVTVTLDSITSGDTDITVGAANSDTVTIFDNDTAEVTIAANDNAAAEPSGNNGQFTVAISNPSDTDTVVSYSVTGTATNGTDYTTLTGSVTILANATTAIIDVSVLDDSLIEGNETVTVTLNSITSGDADISVGAANNATVTISDDDTATWSLTGSSSVTEGANASYTLSLAGTLQAGETATIDIGLTDGTTSAADYANFLTAVDTAIGSRTDIARSGSTLTYTGDGNPMTNLVITLGTTGDTIVENDETYTVAITNPGTTSGADIALSGSDNAVTTTINDDDSAAITVEDVSVAEDGTMTFTATLNAAVQGGLSVDVDFTNGTATGGASPTGTNDFDNDTQTLTRDGEKSRTAIAAYNLDGSPDLDFGVEGKVVTDFPEGDSGGIDCVVQPDEKLVVAGNGEGGDGFISALRGFRRRRRRSLLRGRRDPSAWGGDSSRGDDQWKRGNGQPVRLDRFR